MTRPCVLVTGGAGYIGSHAAMRLAEAGYRPLVYDDLSNGHESFVQWGSLERGDIRDGVRLDEVIARHAPIAIMHFAALIEVAESVKQPQHFYDVNVGGAISVIAAARRAGIRHFVFSSTCATYGEPVQMPMDETHPQRPLNPYGHSKLLVERMLVDLHAQGELRSVILRYFNAAGADPEGRIGERHDPESHAIPLALQALDGLRPSFSLFGQDYPTRDGTAERDYIHVVDLADAHVLALDRLLQDDEGGAFNVGTGRGTTVRELIAAIEAVTGRRCPIVEQERRPGDAPALVADAGKLRYMFGWEPRYGLSEIIDSAWQWHCRMHGRAPTGIPSRPFPGVDRVAG